ncbi:unnamed protein product, partial [Mesorhabditis belari]|uniref:Uncharacterized protein n=1 Tax=Mesorhabditis belari TaxID=2138241 RepID=A0AAF3FF75_9BILA
MPFQILDEDSCDSEGSRTRKSLSTVTASSEFTGSIVSFASLDSSYDLTQPYPIRYHFDGQNSRTVVDVGRNVYCELFRLEHILQQDKWAAKSKKFDIIIEDRQTNLGEIRHSLHTLGELLHVQVPVVESLTLRIYDYRQVHVFGILASHLPFLNQLCIGSPNDETDVNFVNEVSSIFQLLDTWLPISKHTLQTLQVYPGIRLEQKLMQVVEGCCSLKCLLLSRVELEPRPWSLPVVRSFEWDGLGMAFIDSDICLMRRLFRHFPNVIEVVFKRTPWEVVEALLTMAFEIKRETPARRVASKRKSDSPAPMHTPPSSRFGSIGKGLMRLGTEAYKLLSPGSKKVETPSPSNCSTPENHYTFTLIDGLLRSWSKGLKIPIKHSSPALRGKLSCLMIESKRHQTIIWLRVSEATCDVCKKNIALQQESKVE